MFDRNAAAATAGDPPKHICAAKYQRHEDGMDHQESQLQGDHQEGGPATASRWKSDKSHREIHFAILPERYEPLINDDAKEEWKKKKKAQYKKVRKVRVFFFF